MSIIAISGLVIGWIWWSQIGSITHAEDLLFSKIDAAIDDSPPEATDIIAAFELPEACRKKSCFLKPGKIGGVTFNGGNLRQPDDGLIFVLEDLDGSCIRTEKVRALYDTQEPRQNCSHGGCWGTHAQYTWGILSFGLDEPNSACVSSVVVNSLPYQRPYD